MQQMSPALEMMVVKTIVEARCQESESVPVDAAELERALKGALRDLQRTRPRIVAFAPRIALQRVLDRPAIRRLVTRPGKQPTPISMHRLYQAVAR